MLRPINLLKRCRPVPRRTGTAIFGALTAALLLVAACTQAPVITLSLDNATLEVIRGGDVTIEVTLTRTGNATADVALTVTGLPANVTASFDPATLSGATLTSTMTIAADASAAEGSYDLSVVGTGAGLNATAALTLDVSSLTVNGRVVGPLNVALPGVNVGSQGENDLTDAGGNFTLTGLTVPYDLSAWSTADGWVQIYQGLSHDELLLAPMSGISATPPVTHSASVTGTLSGGVIPVGTDQVVQVCVEGIDGTAYGCGSVSPTETSYSLTANWYGPSVQEVRLHALQIEMNASSRPVAYLGYATADVVLDNGVAEVVNLDLGSALPTTTVDVTIDYAGATNGILAAVQLGSTAAMPVVQALTPSPSGTEQLLMPVIDGASYTFFAIGPASITQFGWQAQVTGTSSTVVVPELPVPITPADSATGVTTATNFTALNPQDGPLTFTFTESGSGPQVAVSTMDETIALPDLSPYGLSWTPAANVNWSVVGHTGASVEAATGALNDYYGLIAMIITGNTLAQGSGTFAISDSRTVTLAP